jgi:hypothetical protein
LDVKKMFAYFWIKKARSDRSGTKSVNKIYKDHFIQIKSPTPFQRVQWHADPEAVMNNDAFAGGAVDLVGVSSSVTTFDPFFVKTISPKSISPFVVLVNEPLCWSLWQ